jgi:hypothetical protein
MKEGHYVLGLMYMSAVIGCSNSEGDCDCGYARIYPMCCVSLTVDPGVDGQAFLGPGVWRSLGTISERKDTAMALNNGGEGVCRFVFITEAHDTLLGPELYFEGGYCISGRVLKDTILSHAR